MKNLLRRLGILINSRYSFSSPKESKILFFDLQSEELINNYFKKKDYEILYIRGENLNLNIILNMILKLKFSFKDYIYTYIKKVNPKVVITFIDNSIFFYSLKKDFSDIKFISVQYGYRRQILDWFPKLRKLNGKKNYLSADYIFTFGKSVSLEYSKYIKSKNIEIGSFKNNLVSISPGQSKNKKLLFISQFRTSHINSPDFYCTERILLPLLHKFCETKNINLNILGTRSGNDSITEKNYFSKILKKNKFNFIKKKSFMSYQLVDLYDMIVFIDSTLGYEAIARNKKVAVFSTRRSDYEDKQGSPFGWPKLINENGFFYTNILSKDEVYRVLNNVFNCSQINWKKKTKKTLNGIIDYNLKNKKFFEVVNKII